MATGRKKASFEKREELAIFFRRKKDRKNLVFPSFFGAKKLKKAVYFV